MRHCKEVGYNIISANIILYIASFLQKYCNGFKCKYHAIAEHFCIIMSIIIRHGLLHWKWLFFILSALWNVFPFEHYMSTLYVYIMVLKHSRSCMQTRINVCVHYCYELLSLIIGLTANSMWALVVITCCICSRICSHKIINLQMNTCTVTVICMIYLDDNMILYTADIFNIL